MKRNVTVDPKNPDHVNGPYLVFARSHPAFSDYHDFSDWGFLDTDFRGQMWGRNAVVSLVNRPEGFKNAGDIPEWVEHFEVASISAEFGSPPRDIDLSDDGGYPTARNLTAEISPGATPDKRFFDRRLLIVVYSDDVTDRNVSRRNDRIRARLGRTSATVWHSEELFGFAFKDARSPQDIANSLLPVMEDGDVYDFVIFKVADVLYETGIPSALSHFLESAGR